MRSLIRVPLVAVAAFMVLASSASAQVGSDVGGAGSGVVGSVMAPAPGVTVFASCVVARPTDTTVWFGYSHAGLDRRVALVASGSAVFIKGFIGALNRGQVTQFQPGRVERAFAVTVPAGSTVTWTVKPTNVLGVSDAPSSATNSRSTPACPAGVGVRSATPQIVGGPVPGISATPVNRQVSNGLLVRSSLQFSTNGVVSACSNGGVPLPPKVLWGYGMTAPGQAGGLIVPAGAPFVALPANKILRTDVFANGQFRFQRSIQATRRIVDPQRVSVFGTIREQLAGTAQVAWGYSSIAVIADVEARCKFSDGAVVTSSTKVWVDSERGSSIDFHTVTDRGTQTTRPAVFCLAAASGCDVRAIGVGPGGRSFR